MRFLYPGQIGISSVGFCGESKTGELGENPSIKAKTNNKLNRDMAPSGNRTRVTMVRGERSQYSATLNIQWQSLHIVFWLGALTALFARCYYIFFFRLR